MGGSCSETGGTAFIARLAMATHADQILAKLPGMGVDEGLWIVTNEMARTLRLDSA